MVQDKQITALDSSIAPIISVAAAITVIAGSRLRASLVMSAIPLLALQAVITITSICILLIGGFAALPAQAQSSLCGEWEVFPTPVPETGFLGSSDFRDVVAIAPDDIWAVGEVFMGNPGYATRTLAMHFDGTEWSIVPTPNPSYSINSLECVAAYASDDVWAAGLKEDFNPFGVLRPLVLHWDGSVWEEIVDPALVWDFAVIWTIEIVGPNDIWFGADGTTQFHWNGTSFEHHQVPSFDTGNCSGSAGCGHSVVDIAAVASDDVWAVGGAGDGDYSYVSQIWHWDGTEWTHTPGPSIPYWQRLRGVVAFATDDVWAVGDLFAADTESYVPLIIHWDGAQWSRVATPLFTQPSGGLNDVVALAPDDIWAAGMYTEGPQEPGLPLTMHYDGSDWRQVTPDPNGPESAWLRGITAPGSCDLWAVGSSMDAPFAQRLVPGWPAEIQVAPLALDLTVTLGGQVTSQLLIENLADVQLGETLTWSLDTVNPPPEVDYTWTDSDQPGGPTFAWKDITDVGTSVTLFDDWYVEVILPFTFWLYGQPMVEMMISSNGYLTFEGYGYSSFNRPIPNAAVPNDMIAMFWDDLNPNYPTAPGTVHYYHDTLDDEFIVQYTNVPRNTGGLPYTFEVILRPNGNILYQYLSMQGDLTSATIGIENGDGSDGIQVVFDGPYVHDNLAVLFSIPGNSDWLSGSPTSSSLPAQSSTVVDVVADASGLPLGTYTASLIITSSDPDEISTWIPVTLTVTDTTTEVGEMTQVPASFRLHGNQPNPFNPSTTIRYELPSAGRVRLAVYDVTGRLVRILVNEVWQDAGEFAVSWDGRDTNGRGVASGVYLYRLDAGAFTGTGRATLIR